MFRRILILSVAILASNILYCQRSEDFAFIATEKLIDKEAIVNSNHKRHSSKKESLFLIVLKSPIMFYREFISTQLKPRCYFYPSCSQFSIEAMQQYGIKGFFLGIDRITRCNVFSEDKYPYYNNTHRLYDPVNHYH